MTLEEKIELIKNERESAIAALTLYIDTLYNSTNGIFETTVVEKEGEKPSIERVLKPDLNLDEQTVKFAETFEADAKKYEKVRTKLSTGDFNLSLPDVARVGLAYTFSLVLLQRRIDEGRKAVDNISKIVNVLIDSSEETQNIDFSKEE